MHQQAYETTYEVRESEPIPIQLNQGFLRDKHGILKIIEIVLTIIVFICVGSHSWFRNTGSGGWINFTAALSLIVSTFFFIVYLFNIIHKLPGQWVVIDFCAQAILCFLLLISMIVAAAFSPFASAAVAAAVFCALLSLAYLIEAMVRFSIRKTNNQITVIMRGVITTGGSGPAFQPAPTEPPPSDPMGRSGPYPTDSYGMP